MKSCHTPLSFCSSPIAIPSNKLEKKTQSWDAVVEMESYLCTDNATTVRRLHRVDLIDWGDNFDPVKHILLNMLSIPSPLIGGDCKAKLLLVT